MLTPKGKQSLDDYSYLQRQTSNQSGNFGIIQSYNMKTNTATVLLSAADSDLPGDIITDVLCPVLLGVQTVGPEPGRPCWVVSKGGKNDRKVAISHYFNHKFEQYDYTKQYLSRSSIARYMMAI